MKLLTIFFGLLVLCGIYKHLRYRIFKFDEGKFKLKIARNSRITCISFYKWLYVSDLGEASKILDTIIKEKQNDIQNKSMDKEDPKGL